VAVHRSQEHDRNSVQDTGIQYAMKTRLSLFLPPLLLFSFRATAAFPSGNIVPNGDFEENEVIR